MNQVTKISIHTLAVLLIIVVGCNSPGSKTFSRNAWDSLFTNGLDLKLEIRESMNQNNVNGYRILPKHIKGGHFIGLVRPDENRDDLKKFYLLAYDLQNRQILCLVQNPFEYLEHHEIEFDYADERIYASSQAGLEKVFYYDCKTKERGTIEIPDHLLRTAAGSMVVHNNNLYFTHSPQGSLVYNITKNKVLSFRNDPGSTISYIYAESAVPLSANLNLVSGKREGSRITASLFDSALNIRCNFSFDDDNPAASDNFKILASDSVYVIFNRRACQQISRHNCESKWTLKLDHDFQNSLRLSEQNILCVVSGSGTTDLFNIETKTGSIVWQKHFPFSTRSRENITINLEKKLIIAAGKDAITALNYDGEVLNLFTHQPAKRLGTFEDLVNDNIYTILRDDLIYW